MAATYTKMRETRGVGIDRVVIGITR